MKVLFTSEEVVDICQGKYYSRNLQQHIDKYRYLGDIICVCYSREVEKTNFSEVDEQSAKFVFTPKVNTLNNYVQKTRKRKEIIRDVIKDVDMVVCHVPSGNSYPAIQYAKKIGIPYFLVVVGCAWDALWNYDWRGKLLAYGAYKKLKNVVKKAPYTIYVTQKFLQERYPCNGITEYASNVCLPKLSDDVLDRRLSRINNMQDGRPINIITAAAVDVRFKGQEYVIGALKILNLKMKGNYHYYLVGGGEQSYLKQQAIKLGVEQYVHFVGALPHNEMFDMLDKMDIYIQPSKQEGLPRALIEAMSRGLPAIGTNIAGIPELLHSDYLVRKSSVDDIVNVICKMTPQSMKQQAIVNFNKSKEYVIDKINIRREKFFRLFLNQCFSE